jgi:hypothetical protein
VHGAAIRLDVLKARLTTAVNPAEAMSISTPEPNMTVSNAASQKGCVFTRIPAEDNTSPPSSGTTVTWHAGSPSTTFAIQRQ